MLALAWTHAKSFVTDHISLLLTLPENRHQYLEMNMHERLSLADGIVLVHYLGVQFISTVDPWQYPDEEEETPGPGCRKFTQSAVDQATSAGNMFSKYTADSKTSYLLSPLLVQKGERPNLIRESKAAREPSSQSRDDVIVPLSNNLVIRPIISQGSSTLHPPPTHPPTPTPAIFGCHV